MDNGNNSGVNTILLVVIIAIVVGGLVWFLKGGTETAQPDNGASIDITLPSGDEPEAN